MAFSAALSYDLTLNGDIKVKFDHVIYGESCDYSPTTGVFTASVGGLYEFHVTAKGTTIAERLNLELWTNDDNRFVYGTGYQFH